MTETPKRDDLELIGWGVVGEPGDDLFVTGPAGRALDLTGYSEADYWSPDFLGPDVDGIVPVYSDADGRQFPGGATTYDYVA